MRGCGPPRFVNPYRAERRFAMRSFRPPNRTRTTSQRKLSVFQRPRSSFQRYWWRRPDIRRHVRARGWRAAGVALRPTTATKRRIRALLKAAGSVRAAKFPWGDAIERDTFHCGTIGRWRNVQAVPDRPPDVRHGGGGEWSEYWKEPNGTIIRRSNHWSNDRLPEGHPLAANGARRRGPIGRGRNIWNHEQPRTVGVVRVGVIRLRDLRVSPALLALQVSPTRAGSTSKAVRSVGAVAFVFRKATLFDDLQPEEYPVQALRRTPPEQTGQKPAQEVAQRSLFDIDEPERPPHVPKNPEFEAEHPRVPFGPHGGEFTDKVEALLEPPGQGPRGQRAWEDVGERIPGARKEAYEVPSEEQAGPLRKETLWPAPDVDDMRARGYSPQETLVTQMIWRSVPSTPAELARYSRLRRESAEALDVRYRREVTALRDWLRVIPPGDSHWPMVAWTILRESNVRGLARGGSMTIAGPGISIGMVRAMEARYQRLRSKSPSCLLLCTRGLGDVPAEQAWGALRAEFGHTARDAGDRTKASLWPKPDVWAMQSDGATAPLALATLTLWTQLAGDSSEGKPGANAADDAHYETLVSTLRELSSDATSASELLDWTSELLGDDYGDRLWAIRRLERDRKPTVRDLPEKYRAVDSAYLRDAADAFLRQSKPMPVPDDVLGLMAREPQLAWQILAVQLGEGDVERALQTLEALVAPREGSAEGGSATTGIALFVERARARAWELAGGEYVRSGGRPVPVFSSAQQFLDEFGLRGVQFGNWMDDASSRAHVQRCAEALVDMADIMGVSHRALSADGRLSLAFGARGHGRFAATYEPRHVVINITKIHGAGSLAHEWAHFLDHMAGTAVHGIHSTRQLSDTVASDPEKELECVQGAEAMAPLARAIAEITRAILQYRWEPTEITLRAEDLRGVAPTRAMVRWTESLGGDADRIIRSWAERSPERLTSASAWRAALRPVAVLTGRTRFVVPVFSLLRFCSDAKALGEYWSRPHEMFARAFAAYVRERGERQGKTNSYMVHKAYTGLRAVEPDPVSASVLRPLFDKLVDAIQQIAETRKSLLWWEWL